jgi:hypothetical protein
MRFRLTLLCAVFLTGCKSTAPNAGDPPQTPWYNEAPRQLEGERLVFTGNASAVDSANATFRSEGMALEDMANECSLVPRSAHVDKRYTERGTYEITVYTRVSVPAKECEDARQALNPSSIRAYAQPLLNAQLKRYQDYEEFGVIPAANPKPVEVPGEVPSLPERDSHWDETLYYYVLRQGVMYEKQVVILTPENSFAPFSPAGKAFAAALEPALQELESMLANNPSLKQKAMAWSQLPEHPRLARPSVLSKKPEPPPKVPPRKHGGPVRPPKAGWPKKGEGR